MVTTITLQEGEWVDISTEASLVAESGYLLSSPNKPVQIIQSATVPSIAAIGATLNNWQPSIILEELGDSPIYAKSSSGLAYLSVMPAIAGGGGGGTTTLGEISPTVATTSTSIVVAPQTNYMFIGDEDSTVNFDISELQVNREFYVFTEKNITITVNGEVDSTTAMGADTFVKIIKSASFTAGYSVVG